MWYIYLIETLSAISWAALSCLIVTITFLGTIFIAWAADDFENHTVIMKTFKYGIIFCVTCVLIFTFIPSKKSMYLMAGAHIIEQIDNDKLKQLPEKTADVLNKTLDKLNKELE